MPIFVCLWAYIMCLVVGSFDRSWLGTGYGSNLYFIFYKFSLFFVVLLALVGHILCSFQFFGLIYCALL